MSVSLSRVDGPGDAELISAVRGGDLDAYGELFARHVDAARRLARQLAGPGDSDDLVSDAFAKVLAVLQRGGGPDLAFRAYLLTAVRRLHVDRLRSGSRLRPVDDLEPFDPGLPFHDTAVEGFDNAAAARAFASLPERWQMVLWHTEVEQQKPADIAPLLGMSANSVSALAYRAREGLRQAFLSQHAADPDDVDCAWTRDHLGAYIRGGLSRRDTARVDDHLEGCRACAAVYLELNDVNSGLAALIAPLLLGSAGVAYYSSFGVHSGAGASAAWTATRSFIGGHTAVTAVGGVLLTAAASVAIYVGAQAFLAHDVNTAGDGALHQPPSHSATHHPGHHGKGHGKGHHVTKHNVSPSGGPSSVPTAPVTSTATTAPTAPGSSDTTSPPTSPPTSEPTSPPTSAPPPVTITFDSTPPVDPAFGDTYKVKATSDSGADVAFSIDGATTHQACSIDGSTVTFDHAGTCVIDADLAGSSRAASGSQAQQQVDVPKAAQVIRYTSTIPTGAKVGDPTYTVNASGGDSDNPVTFSVDPSTTNNACSLAKDGQTFHWDHVGTCVIAADQAGNGDYLPADTNRLTVDVGPGVQAVSFDSTPPVNPALGDTYEVSATGGGSGNPVTFSIDPATTQDACTILGSTVTFRHAGTCVIDADQAGNDDYFAAPTVSQRVDVGQADQAITFTSTPPVNPAFGDTYDVSATGGGSGNPVTFSIDPATTHEACTIAGSTVTFGHAGTCVIDADQAGNIDYNPAPTATQSIGVPQADQAITFTSKPPTSPSFGDTYDVTATGGGSGNPVTFSIDPATTHDACTIAGSTVTFGHAGTCVIDADQAGDNDYTDAPTVTQTVGVPQESQAITFTSTPPSPAHVGTTYDVSATGGDSGNPVVFSSRTQSVCTVLGSQVTFVGSGTCTVAADQAGDNDYTDAPTVTQDVRVDGKPLDLWISATVSGSPPLPWDRHWHEVDVTVHDLAIGSTATVTGSAEKKNVHVLPELNCWFQVDGVCHVKSPPTDATVEFFVWLPDGMKSAQVTFTVASVDSPDPDPTNDSVTVTVPEFNAGR